MGTLDSAGIFYLHSVHQRAFFLCYPFRITQLKGFFQLENILFLWLFLVLPKTLQQRRLGFIVVLPSGHQVSLFKL